MQTRLKEILNNKDMSAYRLSKLTGISELSLGRIINNKTNSMQFDTIEKLCNALDVEPNDLFEIERCY